MKPLTLEETKLKEEMKQRCLAKGQYIDESAKAKFDMLCHLEDFEVQYWKLQQENKQLKDNWNTLKKFLKNTRKENLEWDKKHNCEWKGYNAYSELLIKMQELEQRSDINVKD